MHQMEMDEARVADRLDKPTQDLFNPLSLPMKRFWQDEDRIVPDPIEMHTEPTASPEAALYDQPDDEPMPEPEVESVAEASAPIWECCKAHTKSLSRFECFCKSLRNLAQSAVFPRPALEPPSQLNAPKRD